jgi:hypothetical protein
MDDDDLAHNFKKYRKKFWIRKNLWIPDDTVCIFRKIKKTKFEAGEPSAVAMLTHSGKIILSPEIAHCYFAAHISLLHEMAHLYIRVATKNDGRFYGHGKMFKAEIDRLYALGAFRHLI